MATASFHRVFHARWGDMDFNAHLRNTAYLDMAADLRLMYFADCGFSLRELERRRVGPVILHDEVTYFKEMRLLEPITATLQLAGSTADGSRFRFRNEFFDEAGRMTARVTSLAAWLDLDARRIAAPPEDLAVMLRGLARSDDYEDIQRTVRG